MESAGGADRVRRRSRDDFGYSVAVSGSTAVVGAHWHAVDSNAIQGAAYVFVQSGGTWSQQAELIASDGAAGTSSAIPSRSVAARPWWGPDHTVGSSQSQGAAYVFVESGGTWSQQAELIASDGAADDGFGYSVAVSGSTAVVGAPITRSARITIRERRTCSSKAAERGASKLS